MNGGRIRMPEAKYEQREMVCALLFIERLWRGAQQKDRSAGRADGVEVWFGGRVRPEG
jgi:hypothetical protein